MQSVSQFKRQAARDTYTTDATSTEDAAHAAQAMTTVMIDGNRTPDLTPAKSSACEMPTMDLFSPYKLCKTAHIRSTAAHRHRSHQKPDSKESLKRYRVTRTVQRQLALTDQHQQPQSGLCSLADAFIDPMHVPDNSNTAAQGAYAITPETFFTPEPPRRSRAMSSDLPRRANIVATRSGDRPLRRKISVGSSQRRYDSLRVRFQQLEPL